MRHSSSSKKSLQYLPLEEEERLDRTAFDFALKVAKELDSRNWYLRDGDVLTQSELSTSECVMTVDSADFLRFASVVVGRSSRHEAVRRAIALLFAVSQWEPGAALMTFEALETDLSPFYADRRSTQGDIRKERLRLQGISSSGEGPS